jgi:putative acetyltransferase
MSILTEPIPAPTDDARALLAELDAELASEYDPRSRHGLSIDRLFQPHVSFFIARLDDRPAGCGGIAFCDRDEADQSAGPFAELKRMYVRPAYRGQGVGAAILARLEVEARQRNIARLTLETGDAQRAAIRFYEKSHFTRRAPFGDYAAMPPNTVARSVFFQKIIQ